jgi:hypothetical protein
MAPYFGATGLDTPPHRGVAPDRGGRRPQRPRRPGLLVERYDYSSQSVTRYDGEPTLAHFYKFPVWAVSDGRARTTKPV